MTFQTITLGNPDVPLQLGGRGPDEPIWYFGLPEQYELALKAVIAADLAHTTGVVDEVPADDLENDAGEFQAYLELQLTDADGINRFQRAFLDTYCGGEYAHITSGEEIDGDTLALFLFNELGTDEGCDTPDEAARRLAQIKEQVEEVIAAVADVVLKG